MGSDTDIAPHAGIADIEAGAEIGGDGPDRPLRADAERNLRRLLDAAREVFAEQGLGASVEEIARRASVGKGTVFRRFPTKEHLITAIVADRIEEAIALVCGLSEQAQAGEALLSFMRAGAGLQSKDRGFFESVASSALAEEHLLTAKARLLAAVNTLLARAQEQGAIRADVTAEDLLMLQCGCVQAAAPFHDQAPELWQRYLDIAFDGLRADGAHPLSQPAPAALSRRPPAEA